METDKSIKTQLELTNKQKYWWAKRSLITSIKRLPTKQFGKRASINRKRSSTFEKHTFFPGNEVTRISYKITKGNFIISPDSYLKVLWDLLILILSVTISFTITFTLSYNDDLGLSPLYRLTNVLYVLDLVVQSNSAYSDRGHIVFDRVLILKNYLKTWLIIDLLSGIPYELLCTDLSLESHLPLSTASTSYRLVLLFKLLKILKFHQTIYKMQYLFAYTFVHTLSTFFNSFFIVSFCIHIAACIHNIVYIESLDQGLNTDLNWNSSRTRHLHFLHRAVQTVTSVGFGDTKIASTDERLVAALMMICTSGLMGYFVGSLETILSVYNAKQNFYHDVMMRFKKYASAKDLPQDVRRKVLNYYRHLIQMSKIKVLGEDNLLSVLSTPLKAHVNLIVHGYVLMKVASFTNYSPACKKALGERMTIEMYSPNDIIIKEGQLSNSLYFIILGKVEIFHQSTRTVFVELTEGNFFGEIAFFTKTARRASSRSIGYSELFCLSRFDYEEVTKNLPKDKEKGEVLIRNYKKYGLAALGIKCYFCRVNGHVAPECPSGAFKVSIQKIMRMYQIKKNKANRRSYSIPKKQDLNDTKKILKYEKRNTKGLEVNYENIKSSRLNEIIKMNYFQLYKKKRKLRSEVYKSDSEEENEPYINIEPPIIDISNSRKERSSTIMVSNNFRFN